MTSSWDVVRLPRAPMRPDGDDPAWAGVAGLRIAAFHPASSDHRPQVEARLGVHADVMHVLFRVAGELVVSRPRGVNGEVYRDSCVEIFLAPVVGRGYVNIEANAGGDLHASHIRDHRRTGEVFADRMLLAPAQLARIDVRTTQPRHLHEVHGPSLWHLSLAVPIDLLADILQAPVTAAGRWRANLFSCAEDCARPHWASWAPIGEQLNFHQPERFGDLRFA